MCVSANLFNSDQFCTYIYTHSHQEIISYTLKAEAVLWIINNWMPKICIVADVGGGGGGDW